jgi:hypothetical protein
MAITMPKTLFFSWQADTPNRVGRTFLKTLLEEVCAEISWDTSVDEAMRVDSDTQGVAGQPPIADTILRKLDESAVIVADMTFTGVRKSGRPTPNPNVLIEYGWALKSLGHSRVICVMNAAYGRPGPETLPFDLAHLRWPIAFELAEDVTPETKAREKTRLKKVLLEAIRASLATVPVPAPEPLPSFRPVVPKDGPARFRAPDEPIGIEDDFMRSGRERQVYLAEGATLWLRVMPENDPGKAWTAPEMMALAMRGSAHLLPLLSPSGGYSYLRASDGIGMYRAGGNDRSASQEGQLVIEGVAFAFRSGEIWSVETALLQGDFTGNIIAETKIEEVLSRSAANYLLYLQGLGVPGPFHWQAGLWGTKGRRLAYEPAPGYVRMGPGPVCVADQIEAEGEFVNDQSASFSLLPFFQKIFEECGMERPDYISAQ